MGWSFWGEQRCSWTRGPAMLFQINKSLRETRMISSTNETTAERRTDRLRAFCTSTLLVQHMEFGCKCAQKQDERLLWCQCRWSWSCQGSCQPQMEDEEKGEWGEWEVVTCFQIVCLVHWSQKWNLWLKRSRHVLQGIGKQQGLLSSIFYKERGGYEANISTHTRETFLFGRWNPNGYKLEDIMYLDTLHIWCPHLEGLFPAGPWRSLDQILKSPKRRHPTTIISRIS